MIGSLFVRIALSWHLFGKDFHPNDSVKGRRLIVGMIHKFGQKFLAEHRHGLAKIDDWSKVDLAKISSKSMEVLSFMLSKCSATFLFNHSSRTN